SRQLPRPARARTGSRTKWTQATAGRTRRPRPKARTRVARAPTPSGSGTAGSDPFRGLAPESENCSSAEVLQLLEELSLLLVNALRHVDAYPREHVALAGAAQLRRAAAFDTQQLPIFTTGRDLQRHRSLRSRHVDLAAERRGRERHRHVHHEVVATPFIRVRHAHARDDDEVACGT